MNIDALGASGVRRKRCFKRLGPRRGYFGRRGFKFASSTRIVVLTPFSYSFLIPRIIG